MFGSFKPSFRIAGKKTPFGFSMYVRQIHQFVHSAYIRTVPTGRISLEFDVADLKIQIWLKYPAFCLRACVRVMVLATW
jgi:hypothetical protein